MGTSQSSGGPASGVPMVPPWVPPPPGVDPPDGEPPDDGVDIETAPVGIDKPANALPPVAPPVPLAPRARFGGVRSNLGNFARTGSPHAMRRSLGQYVRTGYGGASTASRRFGGTASTASVLGHALAGVASGQAPPPGSPLDPVLLAGRSVQQVMDAVVEAVRPVDGTQDAEAARVAIRDALSELLTRFPDADLLNLNAEQRSYAIEQYTANDVFRRFQLDVGKTIQENAPNASTALLRLKQVRDYVKEAVAASFRKLREASQTLTSGRISRVVMDAVRATFQVFEAYAK